MPTTTNARLGSISFASNSSTMRRSNVSSINRYEHISAALGMLVVLVSGAALAGWFTDSVTLKGIRAGYIPMAPNTALVFILVGAILAVFTASRRFQIAARTAAVMAAVLVATRLGEYVTDLELKVDHWFFRFPAEPLGTAPVGKMALYTSLTFLLLTIAVFLATVPKPRWTNDLVKVLAVV